MYFFHFSQMVSLHRGFSPLTGGSGMMMMRRNPLLPLRRGLPGHAPNQEVPVGSGAHRWGSA